MGELLWTLAAEHVGGWTGDDTAQGTAVLEARGAAAWASGFKVADLAFVAVLPQGWASPSPGDGVHKHRTTDHA